MTDLPPPTTAGPLAWRDTLSHHAGGPCPVAVSGAGQSLDWTALLEQVDTLATRLVTDGVRCLATLLDNGPAWVVADLAAWQAGAVHLPLPGFFTPAQIGHALRASGADALWCEPRAAAAFAAGASSAAPATILQVAGSPLAGLRLPGAPVVMPAGTVKLTFTSGTTGTPKGVCLGAEALLAVADGIGAATAGLGIGHHLCALPLPVLLENLAGVMAPLRRGARCTVLPLASLGLTGASGFDPAAFHRQVVAHEPNSLILLPQMLRAWTHYLGATGQSAPSSLRLVAVGGAAVGERLVDAARRVGIPACEGYGLSEGASVQTLNLPGADRPGSAGRPLPHARVRVAADGELEVAGSLFLGYLGDPTPPPAWWPTGDLGEVDADGHVWVRGRKKQVLITSYGRNVSPEWVETALRGEPAVAQAVVFGDGQPALGAVLWPLAAGQDDAATDAALAAAVAAANAGLPDYARIVRWVRGRAAFHADTGLATPNGRPQRAAILALHADALQIPAPEGESSAARLLATSLHP